MASVNSLLKQLAPPINDDENLQRPLPQTSTKINEEAQASATRGLNRRFAIKQPNLARVLETLIGIPSSPDKLTGLSHEQLVKINQKLSKNLEAIKRKHADNPSPPINMPRFVDGVVQFPLSEELLEAKGNAIRLMAKAFEEQDADIFEWEPYRLGVGKILTTTPLGDAIGITKIQKRKIERASTRISKRLAQEIENAREEAYGKIFLALKKSQRNELEDIYGNEIKKSFFDSEPESLIYYLTDPKPEEEAENNK